MYSDLTLPLSPSYLSPPPPHSFTGPGIRKRCRAPRSGPLATAPFWCTPGPLPQPALLCHPHPRSFTDLGMQKILPDTDFLAQVLQAVQAWANECAMHTWALEIC